MRHHAGEDGDAGGDACRAGEVRPEIRIRKIRRHEFHRLGVVEEVCEADHRQANREQATRDPHAAPTGDRRRFRHMPREQDPSARGDRADLAETQPGSFHRRNGDDGRHLQQDQPQQQEHEQNGRGDGHGCAEQQSQAGQQFDGSRRVGEKRAPGQRIDGNALPRTCEFAGIQADHAERDQDDGQ